MWSGTGNSARSGSYDDEDDDDDGDDNTSGHPSPPRAGYPSTINAPTNASNSYDQEDDGHYDAAAADAEHVEAYGTTASATGPPPRGKPESMAVAFAARRVESERQELAAERQKAAAEEMDDVEVATVDVSSPLPPAAKTPAVSPAGKKKAKKESSLSPKSSKKTTPSTKSSSNVSSASAAAAAAASTKKKAAPKSAIAASANTATAKRSSMVHATRTELLLHEDAPHIRREEYENLELLMVQMCRVPLLSEFSRPVILLHPELADQYRKIVAHPIDLGRVCRGIRRRKYKTLRDVRLDIWRVFANCVKFHSHPNNKEAVPTFVSIALHLCEFFNQLWEEYMMPSNVPPNATAVLSKAFAKRDTDRRERILSCGVLILVAPFYDNIADPMRKFIENGGIVDGMDKYAVWGPHAREPHPDLTTVQANLIELQQHFNVMKQEEDSSMSDLASLIINCCPENLFPDNSGLRQRVVNRIARWLGKIIVPLHEANSRGVTQSSIWGNIATAIWARENSKKPYWPALCLGILSPDHQREFWHQAITERNEARLPEKLRTQLVAAKKKCEQAIKKVQYSFFMVEFLGTHEFIWVRETDIIENFDPEADPNNLSGEGTPNNNRKSKRGSSRNFGYLTSSPTYQTALEECTGATDEFDVVIADAYEYKPDSPPPRTPEAARATGDSEADETFSYVVLSQSDDEIDDDDYGFQYNEDDMSVSDVDESNWLLSHDGILDTSAAGRKNAKRRTQALRKKIDTQKKAAVEAKKSQAKAATEASKKKVTKKGDVATQQQEDKKELKELQNRRRKRSRQRDRALKSEARKPQKRRRPSMDSTGEDTDAATAATAADRLREKKDRANAIVQGYAQRAAQNDDYKSLALSGVMGMPASMVDPVGLLGMTLAFRAAAGELKMPDDNGEQEKLLQPWKSIDVTGPKSSAERVDNLKKKIAMMQNEVARLKDTTRRRQELTDESVARQKLKELTIETDENVARQKFQKKKVQKKLTPKKISDQSAGKNHSPGDADEEDIRDAEMATSEDHQADVDVEETQEGAAADEDEPSHGDIGDAGSAQEARDDEDDDEDDFHSATAEGAEFTAES